MLLRKERQFGICQVAPLLSRDGNTRLGRRPIWYVSAIASLLEDAVIVESAFPLEPEQRSQPTANNCSLIRCAEIALCASLTYAD